MSIKNWPGGRISPTPPTPSGPFQDSTASGVWTLEQQAYWEAQNLWPTAGNVNPDAFIENLFQTWLYTGNSSTQTINNGIDLSGKGGMVWIKSRKQTDGSTSPIGEHGLWDTERGAGSSGSVNKALSSNSTAAQNLGWTDADYISAFGSTGFTVQNASGTTTHRIANHAFQIYASWTFREQPKFFDVVTYTGNGANRTIAHNLGSAPGCILVKSTSLAGTNWAVYHRSLTSAQYALQLNNTGAELFKTAYWNSTAPTSTVFTLGNDTDVNENGATYVAYLFAHNAGGFGLTGTDNVISCGTFTTDGSENSTTNLGYEPQWLLLKATAGGTAGSQPWHIFDNMRGLTVAGQDDASLQPNNANAESQVNRIGITSTGFTTNAFGANTTFIYVAIRRGPMRTPTTGTSVYTPYQVPASPTTGAITGFVTDAGFIGSRAGADKFLWGARLMGNPTINSTNTNAESANTNQIWDRMNGWWNTAINNYMTWGFARAPGFFDVVCYTGTGVAKTESHNLGVAPELMIVKSRAGTGRDWAVYIAPMGNNYFACLNNGSFQGSSSAFWNDTTPTSSVFTVGTNLRTNNSGQTYVAYLFASCPGVSKVGSYTGTGTTQVINCGFTAGSRFVMIKRTDSTGDWYVWDSARGIVAGNDPYLLLNSTAAEVTNTDFVDTAATGFEISSTAPAAINANGGTFIFLAIA